MAADLSEALELTDPRIRFEDSATQGFGDSRMSDSRMSDSRMRDSRMWIHD
jgi:hypothetical protein